MSLLYQVSYKHPNAIAMLGMEIVSRVRRAGPYSHLIILCIGTDRCTGDALGPLVGMLLEQTKLPYCQIWGTLERPIHALNLHKAVEKLHKLEKPFVISVDACLGLHDHIGDIQIVDGPLKPGVGVQKDLPAVGDFHLKGIVNASGFVETIVLQNTRLFTVMSMARTISDALFMALKQ